ncbi:ClC family H(+)/Cl(-) exchange transporter [Anaerofustis sp.]|uniref:ClC family H(+)/Cl(-) exchange transporter n=1 Tax=Anaerofustis sp. TaxID=1872517 RepID=UPI0025C07D92|nr:ClC family H(+)/Cl(-) exchange transporter [Anaerofustis sp.]
MNNTMENIKTRLNNKRGKAQIEFVIEGLFIGIVSGLVAIVYRFLLLQAEKFLFNGIDLIQGNTIRIILWFVFLILLGIIVGKLVKAEPLISGSGIPQVSGEMKGYLSHNPVRVIVNKILGGTACIIGGLSLGREGPSIQLGAMAGKLLAKVQHKGKTKERTYISCGAGAGLAAAFNAPLAGIMFTLEEIHKNFDGRVIVSVMTAAVTADFLAKSIFGMTTVFNYGNLQTIPLQYFWTLIVMGIFLGFCGVLYNKGMLFAQSIYAKIKGIKPEYKIIIPFVISGILALTYPYVLAGGSVMVDILVKGNFIVSTLIVLLIVKFLFSAVCFGSGAPGGIFFPLLVMGSFCGAIYGSFVIEYLGLTEAFMSKFIILAMAGFFAATVRAPITGIILVSEMTGSLEHMLSISLVSVISYVVAYFCGSEPIYESLLERILDNRKIDRRKPAGETMLITYNVTFESEVDGKKMGEIIWPKNCLVVSIERGNHEFIPRGYNKVKAGDFITVLISAEEMDYMNEILTQMCCEKKNKYIT